MAPKKKYQYMEWYYNNDDDSTNNNNYNYHNKIYLVNVTLLTDKSDQVQSHYSETWEK